MTMLMRHVVICVMYVIMSSRSASQQVSRTYTAAHTTTISHNTTYTSESFTDVIGDYASTHDSQFSMSCRYWEGYADYQTYRLLTCGHCYGYQFPKAELKPYRTVLFSVNGTTYPANTILVPDVKNQTWISKICMTLQNLECEQWKQCCTAAEQCCETQNNDVAVNLPERLSCPSTWDGFACWDQSSAGQVVKQSCPEYVPRVLPEGDALKTCTENGTWFQLSGFKEWTDYTTCHQFNDSYKVRIFVKIGCSIISLFVLIPSVAIFLSYRSLRHQNRIRLHLNLFSSFILLAVWEIVWQGVYVYDRINNASGETRVHGNSVFCRLTLIMTRYAFACNYFWLFCESLYLHRLMVKAFQPPKKLYLFYGLGWGLPLLPTIAYIIIRLYKENTNCWLAHIPGVEWIFFAPNMLALFINLIFMCDVLRILLTKMQSHPNEPSNFRRAVKASFLLIPMFGLQLVFIMFRPSHVTTAGQVYEILAAALSNLQGFIISLIYCLFNNEVMANLRRSCVRMGLCKVRHDGQRTNYTVTSDVYTRESPTSSFRIAEASNTGNKLEENIPLKPINSNNGSICVDK